MTRAPRLRSAARRCFFALLATAASAGAEADVYPSHPVLIICPWRMGGGTDTVSRFVAHLLEEQTGVPFAVNNRTGGGGVTGHMAGAQAEPDGYTLLTITVEIAMMHHRGLTQLGPDGFQPVMLLNRDAASIFVRVESPWMTLAELLQAARESPGNLRASGTALGGIWHLSLTGALDAAGLPPDAIVWVPSEGAAPGLAELLAKNLHAVVCSLPEASAQLAAGEVRCLGVMAPSRLPRFPEVPTLKEQGVDWSLGGWRGLALPKRTPKAVVDSVVAMVEKAVAGEKFRGFMDRQGYDAAVEGPERFARTMAEDDARFGALIQKLIISQARSEGVPGPWFFPAILGGGLAATGIFLAATRQRAAAAAATATAPSRAFLAVEVLAAVALFILVSKPIGFVFSAGALVLYLLKRLGSSWRLSAAVAAVLVPGVYLVFVKVLRVALPPGPLPW